MEKQSFSFYNTLLIVNAISMAGLGAVVIHQILTSPESTPDWMLSGWTITITVLVSLAAIGVVFLDMVGIIKSKAPTLAFFLGSAVFTAGVVIASVANRKPLTGLALPLFF